MNWKKSLPYALAVIIMIIVSLIYFSPVLSHKQLLQSDMMQFPGMVKAIEDNAKVTGEVGEWTPNMFSGMPSYQISYGKRGNIMDIFTPILTLNDSTNSLGVFFLLALGFFVFMCCMGCSPWLSMFAGLMYALGSYNIILIGVGHITKAWAMAMMAPILGGMILAFRGKYAQGFILFTLSLALQLTFNHIQITYYTLITAVILSVSYLVFAIAEKHVREFMKAVGILIIGAVLSVLPVTGHLLVNNEYVKHTMRGGSELTVHPDNKSAQINDKGLDINYAFNWSYGKDETMTLLIPDYMGGGSSDHRLSQENSPIIKNRLAQFQSTAPIEKDQRRVQQIANSYFSSTYYGDQPFTAGPVYFGSIVIFLALIGFIVLDNKWRWWLLVATILSVLLSWGSNFMSLNSWLFYHLPMFNKFRTPSMALVIANVTMCIAAVMGLKCFLESEDTKRKTIALYVAGAVAGGITLLAWLVPTMFSDFSSPKDTVFAQQLGESFVSALQQDREELFVSDSRRSFIFILSAFVILFVYNKGKIKKNVIVACVIGVLAVVDLWGVATRYVNKESFRPKSETMIMPSNSENAVMDIVEKQKINHFRVYNLGNNPFNEATTSYFLPSIGGYSAAKLQRYQDVIDFYLTNTSYVQKDIADTSLLHKNQLRQLLYQYKDVKGFPMPNMGVLNMLDTRYIILSDDNFIENTEALGAVWFVNDVKWVQNADEEILNLDNFDPKRTAVINNKYKDRVKANLGSDPTDKIELVKDEINDISHLKYKSNAKNDRLAVFSEIFYEDSWHCYIDGKEVPYVCANYILRAVQVPAGSHTIEFRCQSEILKKGNTIAYIGSVLLVLGIVIAACYPQIKKKFLSKKQ